jgi:hemerythrin
MRVSSTTWMAGNLAGMMNEARVAISKQMERLSRTADQHFADGFTALIAELETSFRDEETAMDALNYSALRSHLEQHARALSALHHVQAKVEAGDIALGREALALLANWLLLHRSTMDLALTCATRRAAVRAHRPETRLADQARYRRGEAHV